MSTTTIQTKRATHACIRPCPPAHPQINGEVLEYIERIQDTLDPYGGRFLVHGAEVDVKEGPGTVVIIEFPDGGAAQDWYASPAYREILPLRTRNIDGSTLIVEGVAADYDPARTAAALRKRASVTATP
jgi:uncharacterized protein (DUF1330 family)